MKQCDLLIVGAGAMGLWLAYKAGCAGVSTVVVDGGNKGLTASHGLLGALMPHMPERTDEKIKFQFAALCDLPTEIKKLENHSQVECGFNRCGRVIPLTVENDVKVVQERVGYAQERWCSGENNFSWQILKNLPTSNWVNQDNIKKGLGFENLSARINPRKLLESLKKAIEKMPSVTLKENTVSLKIDDEKNQVHLSDKEIVPYKNIVIAAGFYSYPMIEKILGLELSNSRLGWPVKGQAMVLDAPTTPDLPLIFHNGIYIVPHDGNRVAVGSTSEKNFDQAQTTDEKLEHILSKARDLCPVLRGANVIERWAGLRPKSVGIDPIVGPINDKGNILAMTGGFKTSLGVAHRIADHILSELTGENKTSVPDTFKITHHLSRMKL